MFSVSVKGIPKTTLKRKISLGTPSRNELSSNIDKSMVPYSNEKFRATKVVRAEKRKAWFRKPAIDGQMSIRSYPCCKECGQKVGRPSTKEVVITIQNQSSPKL